MTDTKDAMKVAHAEGFKDAEVEVRGEDPRMWVKVKGKKTEFEAPFAADQVANGKLREWLQGLNVDMN